ncbi:hypothetical protein Q3G72_013349 [Acer saccharum]|nr:hypothetical protein Q3G72_013349 [Acer saccharum]
MFEFTINRAIDLKSALVPLTCLSPTATVINSAKAVSLLHSIPSGRLIAVLQISSTEFGHFNCIEGISTGVDIKMLIGFLNFVADENKPLTMGAAVEDNGGRLTVKTLVSIFQLSNLVVHTWMTTGGVLANLKSRNVGQDTSDNHPFFNLIQSCREAINADWSCIVQHVFREGNALADGLAHMGQKMGIGLWTYETPPPNISHLLAADASGAVCLRQPLTPLPLF